MNESTPRGIADLNGTGTIASTKDFNTSKILTDTTVNNDYVSWGYWAATEVDGNATLMTGTNYWVAGKDAAAAATYITNLSPTSYTYTGKALGSVLDGGSFTIDPTNDATNQVVLKFNFGSGSNAIDGANSWIKFTANSKLWHLQPDTVGGTAGDFAGNLITGGDMNGGLSGVTSGVTKGKFYGDAAQALGGTFKASTGSGASALGVFKAVRP